MSKVSFGRVFAALAASFLLFALSPIASQVGAAAQRSAVQSQKVNKQVIHLKIKAGSNVSLNGESFQGEPAKEVAQLNVILTQAKKVTAEKLLSGKAASAEQQQLQDAMSGYYKVRFAKDIDVDQVTAQLKNLSIIETAYAAPKAAPPPTTSNYTALQTYFNAAPKGIDTGYASTFPGGLGDKVHIFDLEYGWNTNHEDLTKAKSALITNGTPAIPAPYQVAWTTHGTAVLGELIGDKNSFGITGGSPSSSLSLVNVYNNENGYDLVNALRVAYYVSKPGDVVIVEQQAYGPTGGDSDYVPVEWTPEIYDIIKTMSGGGRIVVEPASDGSQNLDDAAIYGTTFPSGKADSGAIIVGAGYNCSTSIVRSRESYSDYGKRVNLQGPGECVVTTGYGDLDQTGNLNTSYTQFFNGTSSAAPVVAAAAAVLSSAYKTLNSGAMLTPLQIRNILQTTGSTQDITTAGANQGNIGQQPNLAKALLKTDITPPNSPATFTAKLNTSRKPVLTWSVGTDNVKVTSYRIYRNGVSYKTVTGTTFTDTNVAKGTSYTYKIKSVDASGNLSTYSKAITLTP